MGITFGDIRYGPRRRARARATVCATAAEYARLWGWEVTPGAHLVRGDQCSCGDKRCATPGGHPIPGARKITPDATEDEVRAVWERSPGASALLPAGRAFDVIDVSEEAGCLAMVRLERMGTRLGPVLATPHGRALFFVAPGAAAELPDLLYKMGWDDAELDLRSLGPGDYVIAPPSDLSGLGPVRWLRPPAAGMAQSPPEARLLLGILAFACHRTRRTAGSSPWLVRS